ncbi:MAG: SPFH domain-containing protein [Ardenticatenales bacterium]|nr:SPFH domain-containing protein [Ardenticatenales bacterium]
MRETLGRIFNPRLILGVIFVFLAFIVVTVIGGRFFYFLEPVEESEIGVKIRNSRIEEVVGPGIYSDVGINVRLERVSTQAISFSVMDAEIITADKQRIGLVVSGDIFRPNDRDSIRTGWNRWRGIYTDDELAVGRVEDLAQQSMKVCVGDRTFDDNIIGTARDELRQCIDLELNTLVAEIGGLTVENLVVPEVILSAEVQTALDAIVQSRLETEKAAQDELKAEAEAQAEQARQEGEIRVEQSRLQEQTRQQTALAQLEQQRLAAQLVVIEAQRSNDLAQLESERQLIEAQLANDLLQAELSLEVREAEALAAAAAARAELAVELARAELYQQHPEYVQLLIVQANASALNPTDKVIFIPEGTTPTLVLPGPGIVPTVDAGVTTTPADDGGDTSTP